MRNEHHRRILDLEHKEKLIDEFYDPLKQILPIKNIPTRAMSSCMTLFEDNDVPTVLFRRIRKVS